MKDLSMQFPMIRAKIIANHKAYIDRFGMELSMISGELELSRTRILAKMKLLCQSFLDAKAVDEVTEMVVSSRDGTYPMSIKIGKKGHPICLYLLNTGKDIILSDSVGLALTDATMETRILLVTDPKRVCRRFGNVLDADFQWESMADMMLDAIHETIYDRHDVMQKGLINQLGS